ncbi:MAG: hypothetical protein FWF54_00540 [Candidatus Azobacteroides sp.]|nr:hypothetical protein [Candidatus Azobacteroides sp.]
MLELIKEYITSPYLVEGIKKSEGKNGVSESSLILRLFPGSPSILLNFQKIKIEREVINRERDLTPYKQFVRESAGILNRYELEFDSDKIPFRITDHDKMWKEWLKLSEILSSKYTGAEVERELGYMTSVLDDEQKLFPIVAGDYPIRELYGRELYKIKFGKDNKYSRDWYETAFSEKLLFSQTCRLIEAKREDKIQMAGFADLKRNENRIKRICRRTGINIGHITSIEQKTVYSGSNMARIPDRIETEFSVRAEGGLLKRETIVLTIKKA